MSSTCTTLWDCSCKHFWWWVLGCGMFLFACCRLGCCLTWLSLFQLSMKQLLFIGIFWFTYFLRILVFYVLVHLLILAWEQGNISLRKRQVFSMWLYSYSESPEEMFGRALFGGTPLRKFDQRSFFCLNGGSWIFLHEQAPMTRSRARFIRRCMCLSSKHSGQLASTSEMEWSP